MRKKDIEDLVHYCVMHNWYDPANESAKNKWTKPDKAMACLRASLSPAVRSIYKHSLGLTEEDQKKPHLVVAALNKKFRYKRSLAWPLIASVVIQPR